MVVMTDSTSRQATSPPPSTRTIAVTGSHGLIGSALVRALAARGDSVRRLTHGTWSLGDVDGTDAVVNLAGENVFQRWTRAAKHRIRESRVATTDAIARAIASAKQPPRVLLSGSAVGIYGANRADERLDETSTHGDDFLALVCEEWEAATRPAEEARVRVVHLRTGIVLARDDGALAKMLLPFRLGLGGRLGNGRQWMSWISLTDHVRAMLSLLDASAASGPVNLVAPEPVRNLEFTKALAAELHRPAMIPVPKAALKIAAGEMASDTMLASQRVTPKKLGQLGFSYEHSQIDAALRAVLR